MRSMVAATAYRGDGDAMVLVDFFVVFFVQVTF